MAIAPLYVDDFSDERRQFILNTRADAVLQPTPDEPLVVREIIRAYGETTVRTRLHQAYFRRDVLTVYQPSLQD